MAVKSEIDLLKIAKVLQRKRRTHQQNQRKAPPVQLPGRFAIPDGPSGDNTGGLRLQNGCHVALRSAPGRYESNQNAACNRQCERESKYPYNRCEAVRHRDTRGKQLADSGGSPERKEHAQDASAERQKYTLGAYLAHRRRAFAVYQCIKPSRQESRGFEILKICITRLSSSAVL